MNRPYGCGQRPSFSAQGCGKSVGLGLFTGMKNKDFYTGLIMLLFSGAIFAQILQSPSVQDTSGPGPFFLPTIATLVMAGLALALLVQSLKAPETQPAVPQVKRMRMRIVWILLWCLIYGFTIETMGYLLSTGIVTFALLAYFYHRSWFWNIVLSVGTPVSIYVLFDKLLKAPLPKGWLGF
jgi:hypothetical protein